MKTYLRSPNRPERKGAPGGTPASWKVFLAVAGPLFAVYLSTSSLTMPHHVDPLTSAVTAWSLGTRGTPVLDEFSPFTAPDYRERSMWLVDGKDGTVSIYPPGAALLAAPLYALAVPGAEIVQLEPAPGDIPLESVAVPVPSLVPSGLIGALTTAIAVGTLAVVFARLGTVAWAVTSAYVFGLGTGAWSVAANALWQHGPAMMWLAIGILAAASARWWTSGLAFGAGILTRPLTGLIPAALAAFSRPPSRLCLITRIGLGTGLGVAALVIYNWLVFGSPSLLGGYQAVAEYWSRPESLSWVQSTLGALLSPERGVLFWSPFLAVVIAWTPHAWRKAPEWVRAAALGGLVYVLANVLLSDFRGGGGYLFYRFPLEGLVGLAPLLFLAAKVAASRGLVWRLLLTVTSLVSVGFHAVAAVVT